MSFDSHKKMALRVVQSVMDQPFMRDPKSASLESDLGRFDNATKAMKLVKEFQIEGEIPGKFYLQFGNWLSRKGDTTFSRECFEKAIVEFERSELSEMALPLYSAAKLSLAQTFTELGDCEAARDLIESAIDLVSGWEGSEAIELPIALNQLACLQMKTREYSQAEQTLLKALQSADETSSVYLSLQNNLAQVYSQTGRLNEAKAIHQIQLLQLESTVLSVQDRRYMASLNNLGLACRNLGELQEAEEHFLRCISLREALSSEDHPEDFFAMNNLAELYMASGQPEKAAPLGHHLLNLCREKLGGNHNLFHLCAKVQASIALANQNFDESANWLERASISAVLAFGNDSVEFAKCQFLLANCRRLSHQSDLANAAFAKTLAALHAVSNEQLTTENVLIGIECSLQLRDLDSLDRYLSALIETSGLLDVHAKEQLAISIRQLVHRLQAGYHVSSKVLEAIVALLSGSFPEMHAQTLTEASNLAYENGEFDRAIELAKESIGIIESQFGVRDQRYFVALREFAYLGYLCGELQLSAASFEKFHALLSDSQPNIDRIEDLDTLSIIYRKLNNDQKYAEFANAAASLADKTFLEPNCRHAELLNVAGLSQIRTSNFVEAEYLLRRSLFLYKQLGKTTDELYFHCRINLALLFRSNKDFDQALVNYNEIAPKILEHLGETSLPYATCLGGMAETHRLMNECDKARPLFERSLELLISNFGGDHAITISIQEMYKNVG